MIKKLFALVLLCVPLVGCQSVVKYPPSPAWGTDVRVLGTVTADSGRWPLALNVPPPEYTYQAALRAKASTQYNVPENQIVLGEVTVKFLTEVVGTIRSWEATAMAGQKAADCRPADKPSQ